MAKPLFLPNTERKAYGAAFRELFTLGWPVVMSRLGLMLIGLADMVVVGHYSSTELGYYSMAWSPTSVFLVTSIGLLVGLQVKTSHFLGSGDINRIGAVFQRGMVYALGLGVISSLVLCIFGPMVLEASVAQSLAQGAKGPLIILALSMPFYMVGMGCSEFLEALGRSRPSMVITMLANVLNLVLLLIMVPGHLGPQFEGAMGAAWSTLIARALMMVALLIYTLRLPQAKPFGLLQAHPSDPEAAKDQRRVGYAAGASYFIEVTAFAALTFYAGRLNEIAVAQWAIVLNFASLVFMVPLGLAVGCSVLVGRAFGAKDPVAIKRMGRVSFITAGAFMILVSCAVILFGGLFARGYTDDPVLIALVKSSLLLSCFFFIPDGLQVVAAQALRARKDVILPTLIHYISYGLIMLPLGYWFALHLKGGVMGLIIAVIIASVISGTFLVGRFIWLDRNQNGW
jgi:multidrug resistance protein, MATE family